MKVTLSAESTIRDGEETQTACQTANGFLRACDNSLELTYREENGEN